MAEPMTAPQRRRLPNRRPNRRPNMTVEIAVGSMMLTASIGFAEDGIPAAALAKSAARLPVGSDKGITAPASPIGAALDLLSHYRGDGQ